MITTVDRKNQLDTLQANEHKKVTVNNKFYVKAVGADNLKYWKFIIRGMSMCVYMQTLFDITP